MSRLVRYQVTFTEGRRWECTVTASSDDEAADLVIENFCRHARVDPEDLDGFWFLETVPIDIEAIHAMRDDDAAATAMSGGAL